MPLTELEEAIAVAVVNVGMLMLTLDVEANESAQAAEDVLATVEERLHRALTIAREHDCHDHVLPAVDVLEGMDWALIRLPILDSRGVMDVAKAPWVAGFAQTWDIADTWRRDQQSRGRGAQVMKVNQHASSQCLR